MGDDSESIVLEVLDGVTLESIFKPSTTEMETDIDLVIYALQRLHAAHRDLGLTLTDDYESDLYQARPGQMPSMDPDEALADAVREGDADGVTYALGLGAAPDGLAADERSPLMHAIRSGHGHGHGGHPVRSLQRVLPRPPAERMA